MCNEWNLKVFRRLALVEFGGLERPRPREWGSGGRRFESSRPDIASLAAATSCSEAFSWNRRLVRSRGRHTALNWPTPQGNGDQWRRRARQAESRLARLGSTAKTARTTAFRIPRCLRASIGPSAVEPTVKRHHDCGRVRRPAPVLSEKDGCRRVCYSGRTNPLKGGTRVDPSTVFEADLALPENDRVHLVERLLGTFGPEADGVDEGSFVAELRRRIDEVTGGKAQLVPGPNSRTISLRWHLSLLHP
jgi:hypothetical protein